MGTVKTYYSGPVILGDFEIIPIEHGHGSGCQGAELHVRRGVNLPYNPVCLLPLNSVWWKFRSIFLASQLCSSLVRIRRTEGLAHYISSELREFFALSSTSSFKIEINSLRIVFWWKLIITLININFLYSIIVIVKS